MVSAGSPDRLYAREMARAVLLLHTLPDGSSHHDWMIERPWGGSLATFRVSERIDRAGGVGMSSVFEAQRLPDHRPAYLDFEGAIGGGRGEVVRLAAGEIEILADSPRRIEMEGWLGEVRGRWEGHARDRGIWEFVFLAS